MRNKGFTLMEILVVLSLLATLAALLFPVFLQVQARIGHRACATQLWQIGVAIQIYVQDYAYDVASRPYYAMPELVGQLYPNYISSKEVLVCPTFRKAAPEVVQDMHRYYSPGAWSSYFTFAPRSRDRIAEKQPFLIWLRFSEVYAERKDQTPIAFCDTHRYGCPIVEFHHSDRARSLNCRSLADPNAPYLILRWGGNVDFVHKDSRDTAVILLTF